MDAISLKKFDLHVHSARLSDTHASRNSPRDSQPLSQPGIQRLLLPEACQDAQCRFCRITMDAEFLEKVHITDQTITVLSFCFAQQHGATTSRPTSSIQIAHIEATAIEPEEMTELPVCREGGWPPKRRATFTYNRSPLSGASSGTCTMADYLMMRILTTGGTNRS
jgi:hypothetical protein